MEEKERGKRVAKGSGGKIAVVVILAVVALLLCGYIGLCAMAGGEKFLPGTRVAGVDVGGKSPAEAAQALESVNADQLQNMELSITMGEQTFPLSAKEAGVVLDIDVQGLEEARDAQKGGFFSNGAKYLSGVLGGRNDIDCAVTVGNEGYVNDVLDQVRKAVSHQVVETSWTVEEQGDEARAVITKGVTGQSANLDGVYERVISALKNGDDAPIVVEVTTTAPAEPDFDRMAEEVGREPEDASLDVETDLIIDHKLGLALDIAAARAAYATLNEGESASVTLTTTEPEVTTIKLRASLFRDLLGEASSKISGDANRVNNVRLASMACNGKILLPGEQMSYNQTTGQRTSAKGYKEASGYTAKGIEDMVGGGVCQPSSTLYLACLYADLEIVNRKNHMYGVSYMPDGMDATVSWPNLDYVFANNTPYPIKVEMTISNGRLTARIYGTKTDNTYVKMESVRLSTTPAGTVYQADETVPKGTTKTIMPAHTGKKVEVYKYKYAGDGSLISRTLISTDTYKMTNHIIGYNPADGAPDGSVPPTGPVVDADGVLIDPATGLPINPSPADGGSGTMTPGTDTPAPGTDTPAPPPASPEPTPPGIPTETPAPPSETPATQEPAPSEPPAQTVDPETPSDEPTPAPPPPEGIPAD